MKFKEELKTVNAKKVAITIITIAGIVGLLAFLVLKVIPAVFCPEGIWTWPATCWLPNY